MQESEECYTIKRSLVREGAIAHVSARKMRLTFEGIEMSDELPVSYYKLKPNANQTLTVNNTNTSTTLSATTVRDDPFRKMFRRSIPEKRRKRRRHHRSD